MDGEHIEICLNRNIPPKLREAAIIELGNMREELYVLRQLASGLTKRAADSRYAVANCPRCFCIFDVELPAKSG